MSKLKTNKNLTVNGSFKECLLALLTPTSEYDAKNLYDALNGTGSQRNTFFGLLTNRSSLRVNAIIEILATRDCDELRIIQEIYSREYKTNLDGDIKSIFSAKLRYQSDWSVLIYVELFHLKLKTKLRLKKGFGLWLLKKEWFLNISTSWTKIKILV